LSAFSSNAFSILSNELHRFDYYLNLLGIEALAEESRASPALMLDVFELRSEVEDAETEQELEPIAIDVQTKYDDATNSIKSLISESTVD
jgi:molecular chaperone HscB